MMFWQKSKTMQYASAKYFHFTVQYAYLREGKRVFSLFQNQKYFQTIVMNIKSKTSNILQNWFLFFKSKKKGKNLFS